LNTVKYCFIHQHVQQPV